MSKEFVDTTLLDGFADGPHITVEQIGSANQGLYGPGDYVMDAGRNAEAQILTNNSIRIFDAVFVMQGRRDVIAANDYEDINIDNGAQGMNRNDIIVRRYTKDESSEIERTEYAVIKGTPTPSAATDPDVTVGNIRNGDTLHEMKLYRVKLEGLNIVAVEPLFKVLMNMNKINKDLSKLLETLKPEHFLSKSNYQNYLNIRNLRGGNIHNIHGVKFGNMVTLYIQINDINAGGPDIEIFNFKEQYKKKYGPHTYAVHNAFVGNKDNVAYIGQFSDGHFTMSISGGGTINSSNRTFVLFSITYVTAE